MVRATRKAVLLALTAGAIMLAALPASATQHHFTVKQLFTEQTINYPEDVNGTVDTVQVDDAYWNANNEYRLTSPPGTTVSDVIWVRNAGQRATIVFASDNESNTLPPTYTLPDTSSPPRVDSAESASFVTVVHSARNAFGGGAYVIQISFASDSDPSSGISDTIKIRVLSYVPGLETWGMIALALLLLAGGSWLLLRRLHAPPTLAA